VCLFTGISAMGAYFFALSPFSGAGSVFPQCLFFKFVGQFDFGCYSLAQEMSFVICYLLCFRDWLINHPL
jgi:hypothetical protein